MGPETGPIRICTVPARQTAGSYCTGTYTTLRYHNEIQSDITRKDEKTHASISIQYH
jgi:hypothetical protein